MAEKLERGAMVAFRGDLAMSGIVWENFYNGPYSYVVFSALDAVILAVCKWSDLTTDPDETPAQREESLKLAHDYILWRASENGQIAALCETDDKQKAKRRAIQAFEDDRAARIQAIVLRGLADIAPCKPSSRMVIS